MDSQQTTCEDLKAYERRLTEVISYMQPSATRWRFVLVIISVCTAIAAYQWICDPDTRVMSLSESLQNHLGFSISVLLLLVLFICGIHKRVVAPSTIAARCRTVLAEFNMSCDDTGKLILKPTPSANTP